MKIGRYQLCIAEVPFAGDECSSDKRFHSSIGPHCIWVWGKMTHDTENLLLTFRDSTGVAPTG